jgi:hypothetical protein
MARLALVFSTLLHSFGIIVLNLLKLTTLVLLQLTFYFFLEIFLRCISSFSLVIYFWQEVAFSVYKARHH